MFVCTDENGKFLGAFENAKAAVNSWVLTYSQLFQVAVIPLLGSFNDWEVRSAVDTENLLGFIRETEILTVAQHF